MVKIPFCESKFLCFIIRGYLGKRNGKMVETVQLNREKSPNRWLNSVKCLKNRQCKIKKTNTMLAQGVTICHRKESCAMQRLEKD